MKTIQHETTVKTVRGVALPEKKVFTTDLQIPEDKADILALMSDDAGVKKVCKWVTDSLKLERNGEVRDLHFPSNPITKQRERVKAFWPDRDAVGFIAVMRLPTKQADAKLDEYYKAASEEDKAAIDAIVIE